MKNLLILILLFPFFNSYGQSLKYRNRDLPCLNKQFNIFVHAVYNPKRITVSEEQVKAVIEIANENFAPICISFKFCEMDTVFNYNYNIINPENELKELSVLYEGYNRINLYIISNIVTHPFIHGLNLGSIDSLHNANIVINNPYALPHELGHFFGLEDTFAGDREELVDGSNCKTAGDKICDTPADPYKPLDPVTGYVRNCVFIYKEKDKNGDYYLPDVGNIMSYYLDCQCRFSNEQYLKMAENYLKATKKHW